MDYAIGRDNSSRAGDGFSRIDTGSAEGQAALLAVREASATTQGRPTLPPNSVLTGVNQWLLQSVAAMANITVTTEIIHLNSSIFYGTDRNQQIMSAFVTHGYDCVVTGARARCARCAA